MTPVESYLADLYAVRGAGTAETSGYPALSNLLNEVGGALKPKITAVIHPANSGAGLPDGGFFSAKELRHGPDEVSLLDLKPERGVLEVKPVAHDLLTLAQSPQVRNYLDHYGQILLTNYRSFALWTWENGKPVAGESFHLAESEAAFWDIARHAKDHKLLGERLTEYLRRALLNRARLAAPRDLAAYLASYAREARARVEGAESNALAPVAEALGAALGIKFEGEKGEHFFRSTLIQTLFYGVFSAWVLWNEGNPKPGDRFRWREAAYHLGLPVLRTLFHQLADPQQLRNLGLEEILDWTEATLARVERAAFFASFQPGEAVQYFYEPFLAEFDPDLRKQFGVWYTPPEIVKYMVARVDRALQENFGLPDGLASKNVVVLDPCCGTGAYLIETLRVIYERMKCQAGEALAGLMIKEAAQKRLFGFELLPAPYVVAHLQIDLLLRRWNGDLDHDKGERAGVFLTNALTGWVPPEEPKTILFPELIAERDAADKVKRDAEILVIIGNPPYSGFAGISIEEERGLSEAYRTTKAAPKPQGQGLNDLYVRFFRMAERRIVEGPPKDDTTGMLPPAQGKHGIVCYISNYSWLDGLSYTGMRERFLEVFDRITVDCLNGDKYKTGKKSPDGTPDPSVFSTEHNREGIQVGTAIAMMERWPRPEEKKLPTLPPPAQRGLDFRTKEKPKKAKSPKPHESEVQFRHWWGKEKCAELLASAAKKAKSECLKPSLPLGLPFVPLEVREDYGRWPLLTELLETFFPAVQTKQDALLTDVTRATLEKRMHLYFDPKIDHRTIAELVPGSMDGTAACEPKETRAYLVQRGFRPEYVVRYLFRPMEVRWLYWEPETRLIGRKVPAYFRNIFPGNIWLSAQQRNRKEDFYQPQVTHLLADLHLVESNASMFPLYLRTASTSSVVRETPQMDLDMGGGGDGDAEPVPNLTPFARNYLAGIGAKPEDLFFHIVAILHAPAYRTENAGALRQDWPRVPLPKDADTLREGAEIGQLVASLLDPEADVLGITKAPFIPVLRELGDLAVSAAAKSKKPDLSLTARWGYAQSGAVMPGPGDVRGGTRGEGFVDVHLNATTRWKDVPAAVWAYTLGGYQVLKKWLSYREAVLLGRPLTTDEALDFTKHVRRIAALLILHPQLDAHYAAVTAVTFTP
ncbi:MAG: type ISP restriction/modification enzyme [Chthoniobacteraceae bacterium]